MSTFKLNLNDWHIALSGWKADLVFLFEMWFLLAGAVVTVWAIARAVWFLMRCVRRAIKGVQEQIGGG